MLVGGKLLKGRNDLKNGETFYGLFLAPKKQLLAVNKFVVIDEQNTFKDFTNVSQNSVRRNYFKLFDGDKLIAKETLGWKKSFSMGVVIPHKMKNCNTCDRDISIDDYGKLVNQ